MRQVAECEGWQPALAGPLSCRITMLLPYAKQYGSADRAF
jgi:hypothetical protein